MTVCRTSDETGRAERRSRQPDVVPRIRTFNRTAGGSAGRQQGIDTSFLESLLGYNARRAALTIIGEAFLERMSVYGLRPVDFSVLS